MKYMVGDNAQEPREDKSSGTGLLMPVALVS